MRKRTVELLTLTVGELGVRLSIAIRISALTEGEACSERVSGDGGVES